jgi:hypothetical protein
VPLAGFEHEGKASRVDMSLAIAYSGDLQIELIEQHNDAPSLDHDVAPGSRGSQHQVGYYCADYEARCQRVLAAGFEVGLAAPSAASTSPISRPTSISEPIRS